MAAVIDARDVKVGPFALPGEWVPVPRALGAVVFAHGSGSSRKSPRNRFVAEVMHEYRLSTLLFDLLTEDEALERRNVFDIGLLGRRLGDALNWLREQDGTPPQRIGLFGASTGAAAALQAAAQHPAWVGAVVSRGGRPDLAGAALDAVQAPTLLIVGGRDTEVLRLNQGAMRSLHGLTRLEVVPGATHLFEEPGALESVAHLAGEWFATHLHSRSLA
jgi:putative phosphoribosyl transferase